MKHRYSSFISPINIILDCVCLNFSFIFAYFIKFGKIEGVFTYPYLVLFLLVNLFWVILLLILKPYKLSRITSNISHIITRLMSVVIIHATLIAFYWIATQAYYYSRIQLVGMYFIFTFLGISWRIAFTWLIRQYRLQGFNKRKYVIVGAGDLTNLIIKYHESHPELGYHYDGYFDDFNQKLKFWRGEYNSVKDYIDTNEIDYIYCFLPKLDSQYINDIISHTNTIGCEVKLLMDFSGFMTKKVNIEYHDFIPVISVSNDFFQDFKINLLKRSFDIIFSSTTLILGLPFFLIISIITKLSSNGPVLYTQERIGFLGKPFRIYKFRSMYVGSEKNGPALSNGTNDTRITPWGHIMRKTRLDELPQFWNVLIGDMSMVGPRPERQHFIDQIVEVAPEYSNLLYSKPGVTSIGQVKYGYASNINEMIERMKHDLTYKPSFQQDLGLIMQTILVMVQGRGK